MISYLYDFLMRSHFGFYEWPGRIENDVCVFVIACSAIICIDACQTTFNRIEG